MISDVPNRAVGLLQSIQVGRPQTYADGPQGEPWVSAVAKHPIPGPVEVVESGLVGDFQVNKIDHGGIDKAVLAYSADHYTHWRDDLGNSDLPFGAFGENLTLSGITEDTVCIGDSWSIGSVDLQVSQPRQPCWKLAKRWGQPDLVKRIVSNGRTGWYLRVLRPGVMDTNQDCVLTARPHPEWTIRRAHLMMYQRTGTRAEMLELMNLESLSDRWKKHLM